MVKFFSLHQYILESNADWFHVPVLGMPPNLGLLSAHLCLLPRPGIGDMAHALSLSWYHAFCFPNVTSFVKSQDKLGILLLVHGFKSCELYILFLDQACKQPE